jgi:ATP/maltotriose-dependent transcriptional regulator MalT
VITRETVHKHLKNIYQKLDVHSRTEAVIRAQALGWLGDQ